MDFWFLYAWILNHQFVNRKTTIVDHIIAYEQLRNSLSAIINKTNLTNDDEFRKRLKKLSKSNTAKYEFLLR